MRKIWQSGFQDEDRNKNIDSIYLGKVLRSDILQNCLLTDSGIVDYDVDLKFTSFNMRKIVLGSPLCHGMIGGKKPDRTRYLQRSRMCNSARGKRPWTQDFLQSPHRYLIAVQLLPIYSKKGR